jgi:hypothetical protein
MMYSPYQPHRMIAPTAAPLRPAACRLIFRQQPHEALVTTEGKEKARKPVDPPPVIELTVDNTEDPQQQFLQSPYLFVSTSLWKAEKDEPWECSGDRTLSGTLVSSLHRLKDISNKDGGFFIFGDISIKVQGTFRLRFSLYNFLADTCEVQCLAAITSDKFKVLLPKDFKGMEESTYLSRAFSDQGVRLRLRKEPRGMMGNKRGYPYSSETSSNTPIRPNTSNDYSSYDESSSPNKRYKVEPDDRKDSFPDLTGVSTSAYSAAYQSTSNYTMHSLAHNRPPSMSSSLSNSFGSNNYIGQIPWTQMVGSPEQHTKPAVMGHTPWNPVGPSPVQTMATSRAPYSARPGVMGTSSIPYSDSTFQNTTASGLPSQTQQHMGYSSMYPPFSQRSNVSSAVDSIPNLSLEFGNNAQYPS